MVFPIYIVADRSGSMAADTSAGIAIHVVNRVISDLLKALYRNPTIRTGAHICVVSFADDVSVDLPLQKLTPDTSIPPWSAGGMTSYAELFERLASLIRTDLAALAASSPRPPMVFMLTDGRPTADRDLGRGWHQEHSELLRVRSSSGTLLLIPFGFGDMKPELVRDLASDRTSAYIADQSDGPIQAVRRFSELVFGSVHTSVVSQRPTTHPAAGSVNVARPEDDD